MNKPVRKEIIKLPVFAIVIFSLALLLFILSVVSLWLTQPIVTMIRSAVVLEEPVLKPENEGKVILLHGKIEARTPVEEPVFGLTFDSPVVFMWEAAYAFDKNDIYYSPGAGEHYWKKQSEHVYTTDATLGEFRIDSRLLSLINTPVSVNGTHLSDTLPPSCYIYEDDGRLYFSETNIQSLLATSGIPVGTIRYSYALPTPEETYTVIGLQENGKLAYIEKIGPDSLRTGTEDPADMARKYSLSKSEYHYIPALISVGLAVTGVAVLWENKRNKSSSPQKPKHIHRKKA